MANNYSVTSFTLMPKDITKPIKLGELAQTFIHLFTGIYPTEDTNEFITDSDEYGYRTLESLFTTLIEEYSLNAADCFNFNDLLPQLTPYFNKETLGKLEHELSSIKLDSDESISLEDLLPICFAEENSNFGSFYSETGHWCSKQRHGEFGGHSNFVSEYFRHSINTGELAYLGMSEVSNYVPKYVIKQTKIMLNGIHHPELKQETVKQLIQQLQKLIK